MRPSYPLEHPNMYPRPIYPRPVPPKPFEYNPQIVSNKLETTYDAVEKIKENYKDAISKVKDSLIGILKMDDNAKKIIRDNSGVLSKIETAIATLLKVEFAVADIQPGQYSDVTDATNGVKAEVTAAYEKAVNTYVSKVREYAGEVSGLVANTKTLVDLVADEVNPLIINDLWGVKDDIIAKLKVDNNDLLAQIEVLETTITDLKARNKTLEDQLIHKFEDLNKAQDTLAGTQKNTYELIDDAVKNINAYTIDTVPLS